MRTTAAPDLLEAHREELYHAQQQVEYTKRMLRYAVRFARADGLTLTQIGDALGITRQRVHQILDEEAPRSA